MRPLHNNCFVKVFKEALIKLYGHLNQQGKHMKKLSRFGLIFTLIVVLSPAAIAEVNPESIIQIFQRLENLEKKSRELHGENEVLRHQIDNLKKSQKQGFLNIDKRMENLSTSVKSEKKPESAEDQTADKKEAKPKAAEEKPANPAPEAVNPTKKPEQPVAPVPPKPIVTSKEADPKKTSTENSSNNKTAPKTTSREPSSYEKETYQAAFNKMNGSPSAATRAFREYIKMQPNSPLAANAQYWIGEIMYSHNNYKGAVDEFIKVLQNYKYSSKAPDAAIKLGYSFYALRNWKYARRTFEDVLKYFPENKNAVMLATKRLEKMKQAGN